MDIASTPIGSNSLYSQGTRRVPSEAVSDRFGTLGTVDDSDRKLLGTWPMKVIPYWIESDPNTAKRFPVKSMVENALCQWQHTTPVRFRLAKTTDPDDFVLRFFADNKSVLAVKRKVQSDYLDKCITVRSGTWYRRTIVMGSCNNPKSNWSKGNVVHEVGHALGLSHEHLQEGRDEYLDINLKALEEAYKEKNDETILQYYIDLKEKKLGAKYPADSDYDFASIVHYPAGKFMKLKSDPKTKEPIVKVQKLYDSEHISKDQVGQQDCVSERDATAIIRLYKGKKETPP